MDKLFIKGLDTTFLTITLKAAQKFNVSLSSSHLDSSSMHVHGEYNSSLPSVIFENQQAVNNQDSEELAVKSPQEIKLTYGYSRDHRPDLKQFIIELICSGDGDIPIFLKLAQSLISTLPESELTASSLKGYKWAPKTATYAGIEQRWLVVESEARKESDLRKLSQKMAKASEQAVKEVNKLSRDKFACEADAIKALSKLAKTFKYHQIEQHQVTEVLADRPDNQPEKFYQIAATVSRNESKINTETKSAGRFIIATNVLDSRILSNDEMLSEYKAQQSCERGFGFLKDPLFFADSIFLKSPERIESLAMIMGLCLLVYTLAQRQIRAALKASQSTIKNQLGKPTDHPTLRWIFQCFQSIHLVLLDRETRVSNWNQQRDFILNLLPEDCLPYYKLVT